MVIRIEHEEAKRSFFEENDLVELNVYVLEKGRCHRKIDR